MGQRQLHLLLVVTPMLEAQIETKAVKAAQVDGWCPTLCGND